MSLHADTSRVLAEWAAPDDGQERLRRAYLDHLAAHPEGVWKECAEGHVTASALLVDAEGERVLLTLHRKLRMWLQTGGHCERADATLAQAALREAAEESGIGALSLVGSAPMRLDRHRTPCGWHLDVQYAVRAPRGAVAEISEESLDLRWFDFAELADVTDASVRRLATATRACL